MDAISCDLTLSAGLADGLDHQVISRHVMVCLTGTNLPNHNVTDRNDLSRFIAPNLAMAELMEDIASQGIGDDIRFVMGAGHLRPRVWRVPIQRMPETEQR